MKSKLVNVSEIPSQGTKKIDFFGREALVYLAHGEPRAILNYCAHVGGPLELKDGVLVCAWHGAHFDSNTGACKSGPCPKHANLMVIPTRVAEGVLNYVYGE